jgi:hypothetical protein
LLKKEKKKMSNFYSQIVYKGAIEVKIGENKQKQVFATAFIPKYAIILLEQTMHSTSDELTKLLCFNERFFDELNPREKMWKDVTPSERTDLASYKVHSNGFTGAENDQGETRCILSPVSCAFNHSCQATVNFLPQYDEKMPEIMFLAAFTTRAMNKGDELCCHFGAATHPEFLFPNGQRERFTAKEMVYNCSCDMSLEERSLRCENYLNETAYVAKSQDFKKKCQSLIKKVVDNGSAVEIYNFQQCSNVGYYRLEEKGCFATLVFKSMAKKMFPKDVEKIAINNLVKFYKNMYIQKSVEKEQKTLITTTQKNKNIIIIE